MQKISIGLLKSNYFENPFANASSVQEIFPLLVKMLRSSLDKSFVINMVYDENTQTLSPGPGFETLPLEFCRAMEFLPLGVGACGTAIREKQVIIIQDLEKCEPPLPFLSQCRNAGLRSLWSVPIFFGDYVYGTIAIFHNSPYMPSQNEIQTACTLATSAASAWIVTKLQKQKDELCKNETTFLEAQQIARLGTWEWNQDVTASVWSPVTFQLFGLEPRPDGVILHSELFKLIHPDDIKILKKALNEAKLGRPYDIEIRIIRPDGEERILRTRKNTSMQGQVLMGTIQDITERKLAEQQLLESREQYRSFIDYNSDGICSFDLNGHFTGANLAFRKLTGYSIYELSQLTYADILLNEDIEKILLHAMQTWQGEYRKSLECTLKHKNGSPVFVRFTNIPMVINHKLVGIYALIKDVTLEKKAEEMLRRSEKLSVVGQLAAGFAHEIRNPLTSLKGFLQLLEKTHKQDRHAMHIKIMLDEIKHIENITSELLLLAKPQADKVVICELVAIIQTVIVLFEPQALLKGIEIDFELQNKPSTILGVPNQIKQVFINLIKNALEAMPNGGTVHIETHAGSDKVAVSIRDEGTGIAEELITQIFEPFFTTKETGTGLGLMVTHNIIERHGGSLHIESKLGAGTTVTTTFPLSMDTK